MSKTPWLDASGLAIWTLVNRHTGRVGYQGGIKANGLAFDTPVIGCSGWVALLLSVGMEAANHTANRELFSSHDIAAVHTWSDRIIELLERRSVYVLEGDRITADTVPPYAAIGLRQGGGVWANNHPRPRGITHVVQWSAVLATERRSSLRLKDGSEPHGLRLTPLTEWLNVTRAYLQRGEAWAADAFVDQRVGWVERSETRHGIAEE